MSGSDAERDAPRRFPHKALQRVAPSLRPSSIPSYFMLLRLGFQRGRAKALSARYHFRFAGEPRTDMTVHIDHQRLVIEPGHTGDADVSVRADGPIWLQIVNRELAWRDALSRGIVHVTGPLDLVHAFSSCFPAMAELS